jgi:hypothetical protein
LAEFKDAYVDLLYELDDSTLAWLISKPALVKSLAAREKREAYSRVSTKLRALPGDDHANIEDTLNMVAEHIGIISEGDNEQRFLGFVERVSKEYCVCWETFARAVLPYLGALDAGQDALFKILDEGHRISRQFGDRGHIIGTAMLQAALVNPVLLEDEKKRNVYLTAMRRVAECERSKFSLKRFSACFAKTCTGFLDVLEDLNSLDDVVHLLRKVRRITVRGAGEPLPDQPKVGRFERNVVRAMPDYIRIARDSRRKQMFFETVFRSGKKLCDPLALSKVVELAAANPEAFADRRKRGKYIKILETIGSGDDGSHCETILHNMDFLREKNVREGYARLMLVISPYYQTQRLAEALIPRLPRMVDRGLLDDYCNFLFLTRQRQPAFKRYHHLVIGTLPYIDGLEVSTLRNWLDKISTSLPNAPPDIERWLRVGLECVKRYGPRAEVYFDYQFKEGSLECKIDELAAIEIMLHGRLVRQNKTFSSRSAIYAPPKEGNRPALATTKRLVCFIHRINKLCSLHDEDGQKSAERKERQKANIRSAFPKFAGFVDILARKGRPLFKECPPPPPLHDVFGTIKYTLTEGTSALNMIDRRVREYFDRKSERRYETIDHLLNDTLTVPVSRALLAEIRGHPDIAGSEYEGFRDTLSSIINALTRVASFDEIRVEENACFLDDLIDSTDSCISTDGSEREATLVYKIGSKNRKRKSTAILELNAYNKGVYVTSLGKVLLVHVKDKEDGNRAKILVEGVIASPKFGFVFDGANQMFRWEYLVYEALLEYAESEGCRRVIFNAEHSQGQQCTHDFTKRAAERVNEHNRMAGRKEKVEYAWEERGGVHVFSLAGPMKSIGGFRYTHHLTRIEPEQKDVKRIGKEGWDGECYFDSWYAWHGGNVWNNGTGYIRGFELDLNGLG